MGKLQYHKKPSGTDYATYLRLIWGRGILAVLLWSFMTPAFASSSQMPHTSHTREGNSRVLDTMFVHHLTEETVQLLDQEQTSTPLGDEACQRECNCCPGICSAFLPVAYKPTVLLSRKTSLNTTIITFEPAPAADLLRPPIS